MSFFSKKKSIDSEKKNKIVFCDADVNEAIFNTSDSIVFMPGNSNYSNCCGCYDCWYKTPAQCRFRDDAENIGELLANCSELTVITESFYGCCSPFTKGLMERGLTFFSSYFLTKNHKTRLKPYRKNYYSVRFLFYGDIDDKQKSIAKSFVDSFAFLVKAKSYNTGFFSNIDEALNSIQSEN